VPAILGISAYYHDSAAALVVDGELVAAAQEERFTRVKHDSSFPSAAIDHCLEQAGLRCEQIDFVGFYEKPLLKFDRLLETYLAYAPAGFPSFLRAIPGWLRHKLHLRREIHAALQGRYRKRLVFAEHHESHAASGFYPSPFEEAAVLTLDGVGEWATASFGVGRGRELVLTHELRFPHSLGLLYSAFTHYCGFKVDSGEYKLMGLAPYGEPEYAALIKERLLDLKPDGSFRLDMSYFGYGTSLSMLTAKFPALFGRPVRAPESAIEPFHMNIAASIQAVTEEIVLGMARHVHAQTGLTKLCLAGGVALNCVANGRLLREGPFEELWVQPAAGDAGGALGVALLIWHKLLGHPRIPRAPDGQQASLLGPAYADDEVARVLDSLGAVHTRYDDAALLVEDVAALLEQGKVVGWMQGRMEFGPRALGARSILGDPRRADMQATMNLKIKFRESFRPFAPAILRERVHEWFDMRPDEDSPYMLLVAPVRAERRRELDGDRAQRSGFAKLGVERSEIPAVTHVDGSARVQTVDQRHGRYHDLLRAFERRTGCPVLINTSFNVRGEPIVCTPEQAYRCFMATNIDALVIENHLLLAHEQPSRSADERAEHLAKFELD
jgi:carbamoyltransferase